MKNVRILILVFLGMLFLPGDAKAQIMGEPVDVSQDFQKLEQLFFIANRAVAYDPATGRGTLEWTRHLRQPGLSFNKLDLGFTRTGSSDFPGTEYDENPALPFSLTFVSPRTVRLRLTTRPQPPSDKPSLMLVSDPPTDGSWKIEQSETSTVYRSAGGIVRLTRDPWQIEILDHSGRLLTKTQNLKDLRSFAQPVPVSFIRRGKDLGRSIAASFQLAPDEKIFGGGESFTRLNKRGQKVVAYIRDAMGAQTGRMYKPIPFFTSSRGYGMFVHTSTPVTFDFGQTFDQYNTIYSGDESLDLFIFLGTPKEVLSEYTALTGRSPVPPLWSFGLWMSRITYKSEDEVREVASKLRQYRIPSDVIHLDTGWFETDWQCNYKFSTSRFRDPAKMISDLRQQGFRISLWQLPYFTSKNELFRQIVANGYAVRNDAGTLAGEDAVLDFSNPETVKWYQGLLAELLKMGVSAIKADFGEDGPLQGLYASGRSGFYEHNLYPLRYNKTVSEITKAVTGDSIIWARSAWAGSQRYPLHWGGDAEGSNSAMAATLRAGLSFGLSGFTYWSHDVGGFVQAPTRDLYRRWLPFGVLTSHTRCHGVPPREPWAFDPAFVEDFRRAVELKYSLMPYILAQAQQSSEHGWPMLRALFMEYPEDPTSWLIEDQYLFGSDLLVAPLIEAGENRQVYLPPGSWIDYQTNQVYRGGQWHRISAGQIPVILLVKDHSVIPQIKVAQSTAELNWKEIDLRVFSTDRAAATGLFALPQGTLQTLRLENSPQGFVLKDDPLRGQVKWQVK
ncbi:MAG TPA: TIM-barrel domain-containing protein [Blastocatellia bacterium]|nr:TIM-barrel domain-containing protein [Blastocatellia bacterium]